MLPRETDVAEIQHRRIAPRSAASRPWRAWPLDVPPLDLVRDDAVTVALRVLICEDDPLQAMALEDMITGSGHSAVGSVRTRAEALKLIATTPVDFAFVDLTLADGLTGPLLARELAARGIRVTVLSGLAAVDRDLSAVDHVFVAKPAQPGVVRALLKAAQAGRAAALGA